MMLGHGVQSLCLLGSLATLARSARINSERLRSAEGCRELSRLRRRTSSQLAAAVEESWSLAGQMFCAGEPYGL